MFTASRTCYIFSDRGPILFPSSRELSFSVFYLRHLYRTTLPTFVIMRVLFPLVALVAGAYALSSSQYQKRSALDYCSNVGCSVSIPNPANGKTTDFGDIGKSIPVDPSFLLSDKRAYRILFRCQTNAHAFHKLPTLSSPTTFFPMLPRSLGLAKS